jgi:hypothetical protein
MKTSTLYLMSALVFTFFLGFIDEGYYSLQTFKSFGNIIVLSGYALLFWVVQVAIDALLRLIKNFPVGARKTIAIIFGLLGPITLIMLWA